MVEGGVSVNDSKITKYNKKLVYVYMYSWYMIMLHSFERNSINNDFILARFLNLKTVQNVVE